MAALSGTAGSAVYTLAGTVVGTASVVGMSEWSLDFTMNEVETTAFGNDWQDFINGIKGWTGSFSGNHDTDSSQTTLKNAALGGSVMALRLYDSPTTYWSGTAYLNGLGRQISVDGKSEATYDFVGKGALTYT